MSSIGCFLFTKQIYKVLPNLNYSNAKGEGKNFFSLIVNEILAIKLNHYIQMAKKKYFF